MMTPPGQVEVAVAATLAAERELELVARPDAEIGGGQLGDRPPLRVVHESLANGEEPLVARVHAPGDPVAAIVG